MTAPSPANPRRIAVFGATGRTGQLLVAQALRNGHAVNALARNPAKAPEAWRTDPRVRLVQGDATDPRAVRETLRGATAVLNALGHAPGAPKDILQTSTRNILAAMKDEGATRIIALTGAGVRAPEDKPDLLNKLIGGLLARLHPDLLADSTRSADLLKQSGLDWTLPRATRLLDKPPRGDLYVGPIGKGMKPLVSREDIARWMLTELDARQHVHRSPVVTWR